MDVSTARWKHIDAVIAWSKGLDPKFAQLSPTQRIKGIWWKRKTAANQKDMVPKVVKHHDCTKVCGVILPKSHVAHYAVVGAHATEHHFVSMVSLPIAGIMIVNLN